MLDSAILRPGRFGCKIYCGLPNEEERLNIIKLYHDRIVNAVNFDEIYFDKLVEITNGFSGAQIEDIYVKIVELVIESQFNGNNIIINNEIINNIVNMII
jgi:SpoVK/Ycf46/Vps4 family AAA+-type ATPase